MTLKSSFRLALNKINVNADGGKAPTSYHCHGELLFSLVVLEETNYISFMPISGCSDATIAEAVSDFVRLITRPEFVSLTFNTLYIDSKNRKVVFRPSIVPCYSYEFDFIGTNLRALKQVLADTSLTLGFLTLQKLQLEAVDYMVENGKYHEALDRQEYAPEEIVLSSDY